MTDILAILSGGVVGALLGLLGGGGSILAVPLLLYVIMTMPLGGFGLIVVFLIATSAWQDIQMRKAMAAQTPSYFDVGFNTRVGYAAAYIALAAFLFWVVTVPGGLVGILVSLGL